LWGGRGVSAGHPCSTHALPRLLRYAAKRAVRIMPWGGSMLDETGFYAPSVAHNALPGRPWPGISVFLGHNSTVSKQLRYSPARRLRHLRCDSNLQFMICGFLVIDWLQA